jgi:threo-3-hydroxy-L-aspartate ammonia-lyase
MISRADVEAAAERLDGVANRTPVFTSRTLDQLVGAEVFLKAESFQRGGSFKFRGAFNAVSQSRAAGVAAFSSGNHAQAVALAAKLTGRQAVILMPLDAPPAKVEATRGYGAEIVTYDRYAEDREALGRELAEQRGLALVPPYDDAHVMAGQGTAVLELLEQAGALDAVVVPVGGGGLIAGTATAVDGTARVVGVEPEAGDDTRRSLAAGERVAIDVPRTIADGLQVTAPGRLTFEVNRERVDEVVTVTDAEIVEAMAFLFDRMKLVTEPSGAVGVAALLEGRVGVGGRVGVIVSGGNVGRGRFCELVR